MTTDQGRLIVVETSSRADYAPTRAFYERRGYTQAARLPGYYAPGDDLVIYLKDLTHGVLATATAYAEHRLARSARRQVRRRALSRPRAAATGGGEFRVSDFPRHGGPHQGAGRPHLAAVRARPAGARSTRRAGGLVGRGRQLARAEHHPPLSRPGAVPRVAGVCRVLPLLYPAAQGG